jgi:hypothetical protein
MKDKFDSMILGAVIGIVTSLLCLMIFYFIKFHDISLSFYFMLLYTGKLLSPVISLSGIPNLGIFFIFLNKKKFKSAKGLILATFILVLAVVILKIIG